VTVRFDDALPAATGLLVRWFGPTRPEITIVRDAAGALTVVVPDQALPAERLGALATELHETLQRFSPGLRRVLLRVADLIAPDDVLRSPDRVPIAEPRGFWLVDRVLTNQDWVREPLRSRARLPLGVGYSIKGGVGRSTALAMLAWHLARQGSKVLLLDLDLEAPGLATTLLSEPELPDYGIVDWCVESLVGQAGAQLFNQMWQRAQLAGDADGSIVVVPAYGRKTTDYVAKLGRVYMPSMDSDGRMTGLADRLDSLIACAQDAPEPPDVVLLDARAGMHDIGSATVTQLGAEVFLFARDDAQTWTAYGHLLQHLRRSRGISWGMPNNDLRWRLKMVAAQSEPTEGASDAFLGRSYSLWTENLYDSEVPESEPAPAGVSAQLFERSDAAAPHSPWRVLFDPKVRDLDLRSAHGRPDWQFAEATFGSFLHGATRRLFEGDDT